MHAGSLKERYKTQRDAWMQELLSLFNDRTKVLLSDSKARKRPEYAEIIKEFESLGEMLVIIPFR
jgi:hypothetical protein